MIQEEFANKAKTIFEQNPNVIGMAVTGSWLTNEIDEFSDLDLILVTKNKIGGNKDKMLEYAKSIDGFLSGFTGEHVGEPRLLICLYENPLLHVDLKFLTVQEFHTRIETPILLLDKNKQLEKIINNSKANYPFTDYQWIEDRFWIWIHYTLQKIGRGEYFEAYDFFGFLRMVVLGPLLQIKNNSLPRGVRKVETTLQSEDLAKLIQTIPTYNRQSLLECLQNVILLYRELRTDLYNKDIKLQSDTEQKVMSFYKEIK